jgi:hypothetical protein
MVAIVRLLEWRKWNVTVRIIREDRGQEGLIKIGFQRNWGCVPDSGDDPSGDGKGSNYNLAKVKTGFGIN